MYKAIFFDIGGVCVNSPLEGIRAYERSRGFPENYLNVAIQSRTPHGAFHRLERNEITLEEFYPLFGREMSDPGNREVYREWMRKRSPNQGQQREMEWDEDMDWSVDGKSFFFQMMKEASKVDEVVVGCVRKLKEMGKWKIVALTNNFIVPPRTKNTTNKDNDKTTSPTNQEEASEDDDLSFLLPPPHLTALFDHYLESSLLHLRKPDPAIFLRACDVVGVLPKHVIMIDDIGENLKSARGVGMTTVRVYPGRAREAMAQVESLLGVELLERKKVPEVTGSTIIHILPYDKADATASSVSDTEMDKELSYTMNETMKPSDDGSSSSITNTNTNSNTNTNTNTNANTNTNTNGAIPWFQLLTPDEEIAKIYELFPVLEIPQPPPASSASTAASSRRKSTRGTTRTSIAPSTSTSTSPTVRQTRSSTRKRMGKCDSEVGKDGVDPFEFPTAASSHLASDSAHSYSAASLHSFPSAPSSASEVGSLDGQRRKRRHTSPERDDTTHSTPNTTTHTTPTFSDSEISYLTTLLSPQTYLARHRRHQYTEIRTRNIERETVRHYLHSIRSDAKTVLAQWDVARERRDILDRLRKGEGGLKSLWWGDNKNIDDTDDGGGDKTACGGQGEVRKSLEPIRTHRIKPSIITPHPHHNDANSTNTTTTTHRRSARLTRTRTQTRTAHPFGVPFPPVLLRSDTEEDPQDFDDCVVRFL
ncbi:hypothetical protein HDU85_003667 [Gaertneriomyces sp. JEL0708]|nr:hypothetical protein HDU85_003667 [Gaertneriomyces sp. JEL0708]